jgi:hypothetical protein
MHYSVYGTNARDKREEEEEKEEEDYRRSNTSLITV